MKKFHVNRFDKLMKISSYIFLFPLYLAGLVLKGYDYFVNKYKKSEVKTQRKNWEDF